MSLNEKDRFLIKEIERYVITERELEDIIDKRIEHKVSEDIEILYSSLIEIYEHVEKLQKQTRLFRIWIIGALVAALVVIASVAQATYYNIVLNNPNVAIAFLYPAIFGTFVIYLLFRKYGEHGNDEGRKRR